jgi:hypothetical protein
MFSRQGFLGVGIFKWLTNWGENNILTSKTIQLPCHPLPFAWGSKNLLANFVDFLAAPIFELLT